MLATLTEFPHPGSIAWLRATADRPTAEQVRILEVEFTLEPLEQRALIAFVGLPPRDPALGRDRRPATSKPASGNRRVALAELAANELDALEPAKPERRPRRSAR